MRFVGYSLLIFASWNLAAMVLSRFETWGVHLPIAVICGLIGAFMVTSAESSAQEERNWTALELLLAIRGLSTEAVIDGVERVPSFCLFLGPFFMLGRLRTRNPNRSSLAHEKVVLTLEELLALATRLVPVALGRPEEADGFGRISTSEQEWKRDFGDLATAAQLVFVLPSERPGTAFEMTWLQGNGFLSKCIFVMPPADLARRGLDLHEAWASTAAAWLEKGFSLPDYDSGGLLFALLPDGKVRARQPFEPARLYKSVAELSR